MCYLETRIEIEGNASDDSWEALELGYKRLSIRVVYYESMKRKLI